MFNNAIQISHAIIKNRVIKGDFVIDATCGNGNDTLLLAGLVGNTGKVYAFDIQKQAIINTDLLLTQNNLRSNVELINDDHANISTYVKNNVKACIFNLGYLPRSDHSVTTKAETTIKAINSTLLLLNRNGFISIIAYTGHEAGLLEYQQIKSYLISLNQKEYSIYETTFINQINNPPRLIIIDKT